MGVEHGWEKTAQMERYIVKSLNMLFLKLNTLPQSRQSKVSSNLILLFFFFLTIFSFLVSVFDLLSCKKIVNTRMKLVSFLVLLIATLAIASRIDDDYNLTAPLQNCGVCLFI